MKKRVLNIAIALVAMIGVIASCAREEFVPEGNTDGYVTIEFKANVPDMNLVQTRAVDPDGAGVQKMTVFCFDANGLFITTVTARITAMTDETGTMQVTVPDFARTLQLVGNQNLTFFSEEKYRGMSEVDVMASLEASAGRMIYWARCSVDELKSHNSSSNPVRLLRNQAKITLAVDSQQSSFVQTGWVVVNSNAFGTVAPYSPEHGGFVAPTLDTPFVTIPDNNAKLGDFLDVRTNPEEYIFETENSEADPIDFIVRGNHGSGEDLYYRISLLDEDGEYIRILRNHHYKVNIVGNLSYGSKTFGEALIAPATNNVWVSVSDNIASVADGSYELTVDQTSVVIGEDDFSSPNTYYLHYTLKSLKGGALETPSVSWMDGNNVALYGFTNDFQINGNVGEGVIEITLNQMGDLQKREGTLVIKSGKLIRKIKVVTVKEQNFEPTWITTNIYGQAAGEHITMMFTISEDCPEEFFPMDVLLSANDIDIRSESGMKLPTITATDSRYGEDNGIGYKYVLRVEKAGKQSVYLHTILPHKTGDLVRVTLEADHFQTLTKTATFQDEVRRWILLHDLLPYTAVQPADEVLYYYLVPQKINAVIEIPTHLGEIYNTLAEAQAEGYSTGASGWEVLDHTAYGVKELQYVKHIDPDVNDEFLLYSKYLSHETEQHECDFDFYPYHEDDWGTGGRVYGMIKTSSNVESVLHMYTNSPKSAETVRIASNPTGFESVKGNGQLCQGRQFRSAVFELANYSPFRFAATINGEGTHKTGTEEEIVETVDWSYAPGQNVEIAFDVTSFVGNNDKEVDPFGTAFDIYIEAPMLELDKTGALYQAGKVEEKDGRFVYHVAASREEERAFGQNERKVIPFKTRSIVSAGDIKIYADETKVVFFRKNFNIQNSSITGVLKYEKDGVAVPVPAGSFVPFEVMTNFNRIGTVTVGANGEFELRLRSEYIYDWATDDVKFQYAEGNQVYEAVFNSLSDLVSKTSEIVLK